MNYNRIEINTHHYPECLKTLNDEAPTAIFTIGDTSLLTANHKVAIFVEGKDSDFAKEDSVATTQKYAKLGYVIVCTPSSLYCDVVVETATNSNARVILVTNGNISQFENQDMVDKVLLAGGLILSLEPDSPYKQMKEKNCYKCVVAISDEIHATLIEKHKPMWRVVEYARWEKKPVYSSKHPKWNSMNLSNFYIHNRNLLDERIAQLKSAKPSTNNIILAISDRKSISGSMMPELIQQCGNYDILYLYTESYYYHDEIANTILGLDPAIIVINPNEIVNQKLLMWLWEHYPQIEDMSYLYYPDYKSIPREFADRLIAGNKFEHHKGTDIREVLTAAINKQRVSEYAPVKPTFKEVIARAAKKGYPFWLVDDE